MPARHFAKGELMRLHQLALALVASLAMSVPAALAAQTTSTTNTNTNGDTTTTTTTTTTSTDSAQGAQSGTSTTSGAQRGTTSPTTGGSVSGTVSGTTTATSSQTSSTSQSYSTTNTTSDHPNRWLASGLIGSNYKNNSASQPGGIGSGSAISAFGGVASDTSTDSSLDFGLSLGYLWHSVAGAEFMANFTPNFNLANTFVASDASPALNTYMFNAIGAVPIGADARFQPYVSGGFGAMTLRGATVASGLTGLPGTSTTTTGTVANDVFNPDESHGAGNIGFGLMGFMGNFGVRGDLRYFRAFGTNTDNLSTSTTVTTSSGTTTSGGVVTGLLPGLNFWRANIGVAFRW
jgi:hypothetical protein